MTGRAALFRWLVACHAFFVSADRVPDRVQFQRFPLRHRLVRILLALVLKVLFHDAALIEAALLSLRIAAVSASLALVLGTAAGLAVVARIRGMGRG